MLKLRNALTIACVAVAVGVGGGSLAYAEVDDVLDNSRFSDCHGFAEDTERLQCYDEKTGFVAVIETAEDEAIEDGSQWSLETETSALDGRTDVWLRVTSENTQPNQIGRATRAHFWVRCMQNRTNAFITFESYTSRNQQVRYKLDDKPIQSVWMETMDGGLGIGIWSGNRAIPFVRGLFGASEMVVGYASFSDRNLEFTFDISGLRQRIEVLAESCEWTP